MEPRTFVAQSEMSRERRVTKSEQQTADRDAIQSIVRLQKY